MENARIVCGGACFGSDRAFCPTKFISCQYEIATCNLMRRPLIQVHPIWTHLCKPNKHQIMGSLQKPVFSRFFLTGPTIFGVFEAPGNNNNKNIHALEE